MKIVFLYGNCLKSGIYETGSENFKTRSKAHDRRPNFYVPNNDIYGPKISYICVYIHFNIEIV